jgi:hypothetical protein
MTKLMMMDWKMKATIALLFQVSIVIKKEYVNIVQCVSRVPVFSAKQ